jgi:hypothetical protein
MKYRQNVYALALLVLLSLLFMLSCSNSPTEDEGNHPPDALTALSPALGATDVSIDADLTWDCSDPDEDELTYDVYFGTAENPPLVSDDQGITIYDPGTLDYNTCYYWKVYAFDTAGESTGVSMHFYTEEEPWTSEGVFAALVVGRQVVNVEGEPMYIDQLVARFDSAFAPCSTITPIQADTVRCNEYTLSWNSSTNSYLYMDQFYDPFIEYGQQFIFNVIGNDMVPGLTDTISFPDCSPYITNITYNDTLSFDGFDVLWTNYCTGNVQLVMMSGNDSTGIFIETPNDGSYTFSSADLEPLGSVEGEYGLVLVFQNTDFIDATGYDSRSFIWARSMCTTYFYLE